METKSGEPKRDLNLFEKFEDRIVRASGAINDVRRDVERFVDEVDGPEDPMPAPEDEAITAVSLLSKINLAIDRLEETVDALQHESYRLTNLL